MNLKWVSLGLLVALLATGTAFYFHARMTSAQIAALTSRNEALVQAEMAARESQVAEQVAQTREITMLRQNQAELLRLRNEVGQLRGSQQALQGQLQTAQQQVQATSQQLASAEQIAQSVQNQLAGQSQDPQQAAMQAYRQRYGLVTPELFRDYQACVNSLRQIDAAKQQWALENNKPETALPAVAALEPYLKDGMPKCPQKGVYTINSVALVPTCTVPGHQLVP